jgi:hypothetical protein
MTVRMGVPCGFSRVWVVSPETGSVWFISVRTGVPCGFRIVRVVSPETGSV